MAEIRYADKHIMRLCTDARFRQKQLGQQAAKHLVNRLVEVQSVAVVENLLATTGQWEELTGNRSGQWSAHLGKNWRLIAQARRGDILVLLIEIVDYH